MPKYFGNSKVCGYYHLYAEVGQDKVLLPLQAVNIKTELRGPMATTNVELTYVNPMEDRPLECTYTLPIDKSIVLSKFEAIIDDRVVKTIVKDKEQAQEEYDDAVAQGHSTVLAQRSTKREEILTVKLGNLLPNQTATIKQTIVTQL